MTAPSSTNPEPIVILLAEDDPAHAEIVSRNLEVARVANRLIHVTDGQEVLDYLLRQGPWADPVTSPRPGLLLLDLRMPKMDGIEVLQVIKRTPELMRIPTVMMTTSAAETDMTQAYENHVNSYIVKPLDFQQFAELMKAIGYYWLVWNEKPF